MAINYRRKFFDRVLIFRRQRGSRRVKATKPLRRL
jgi:hypothetical protein